MRKLQLVWSWARGRGRHACLKLCVHSKYTVFSLEFIGWWVRLVKFSEDVFIFPVYLIQYQKYVNYIRNMYLIQYPEIRKILYVFYTYYCTCPYEWRLSFWKWRPMRRHSAACLSNHCSASFTLVGLLICRLLFPYWISIAQSPRVCFCWCPCTLFPFSTITNNAAKDNLVCDSLRAGQRSCVGYRATRVEREMPFHHDLSSHTYTSDVWKFLGLHFANLLATRWRFPDREIELLFTWHSGFLFYEFASWYILPICPFVFFLSNCKHFPTNICWLCALQISFYDLSF